MCRAQYVHGDDVSLFVPLVKQYTPSGVQVFGVLDQTPLNAEFATIAAAFANQSAWTPVTANTQLTATLRNVLVDASAATANTAIVITLPTNPALGDPPCIVAVSKSGIAQPANCVVTTSDGSSINGIAQLASPFATSPALWMSGDILRFVYISDQFGWVADGILSHASLAAPFAFGACPWQGQAIVVSASGTYSVEALQSQGAFATLCQNNGAATVNVGDSTSTFNGNPGPFVLTNLKMYKFTNIGTRAFEVTP
jgi:hypothetical protein